MRACSEWVLRNVRWELLVATISYWLKLPMRTSHPKTFSKYWNVQHISFKEEKPQIKAFLPLRTLRNNLK